MNLFNYSFKNVGRLSINWDPPERDEHVQGETERLVQSLPTVFPWDVRHRGVISPEGYQGIQGVTGYSGVIGYSGVTGYSGETGYSGGTGIIGESKLSDDDNSSIENKEGSVRVSNTISRYDMIRKG